MLRPNLSQQEVTITYTLDEPVAEVGRKIMASLLTLLWSHEQDLSENVDVTSVHESRKGMRRLRTALALFAPYYEPDALNGYRKQFRKMMRRLARSRDIDVFLIKLDKHFEETLLSEEPSSSQISALKPLQEHWTSQQSIANGSVVQYMAEGKYRALLAEFERLIRPPGQGGALFENAEGITSIGDVAPAMVLERGSAACSLGDSIETAPPKRLHALRIQCKELRYTIEFLEPIMAPPVGELLEALKRLLTHLGDLNDARVHLRLLDETPQEVGEGVLIYRLVKERELESLIVSLPPLWEQVAGPKWQEQLASSLSSL
jgi:triphosphatase